MKRYWKNMYGFRLSDDDTEEPEFFCNVTFGSGSGNFSRAIFSYPQWCVRGMEPFAMPRTDPAPIVEKFMKDLSGIYCLSTPCNHVVVQTTVSMQPRFLPYVVRHWSSPTRTSTKYQHLKLHRQQLVPASKDCSTPA